MLPYIFYFVQFHPEKVSVLFVQRYCVRFLQQSADIRAAQVIKRNRSATKKIYSEVQNKSSHVSV